MTAKRKKAPVEVDELTAKQLAAWVREQIGETKQEAFAAEMGVTRQSLSDVVCERRPPGPKLRRGLKRFGFVAVRSTYLVERKKTV